MKNQPSKNIPEPPQTLPLPVKKFWKTTVNDYHLEPHHVRLLETACFQLARVCQAREAVDRDGLTEKDRFGQTRENPAVSIERSSSLAFQRLMRELGLDIEPASALRGPSRAGAR